MPSLAPIALIIDYAFGYPQWLFARIRHPAVWLGACIAVLEKRLNREHFSPLTRRVSGVLMLLILVEIAAATAWLAGALLPENWLGWAGHALLASSLLAGRSLYDHVEAVRRALHEGGAEAARIALARIVGRDVQPLDESGISRAAIESLSENTSDGLVAPLMWYMLAGLPGMAVYKAVNTADSMVGYKTPRYADFGFASARLDDALNWIPARLTALLYGLAAFCHRRADGKAALKTAWNQASRHASPNAGWPEAAMAGALHFTLGGASMRQGEWRDGPSFGEGRAALTSDDIAEALSLYRVFGMVLLAITLAIALA